MKQRKTRAGAVIRTMNQFVREVYKSPSIYWHGKCFPSACVVSMQCRYVWLEIERGNLRRSVLNEVTS